MATAGGNSLVGPPPIIPLGSPLHHLHHHHHPQSPLIGGPLVHHQPTSPSSSSAATFTTGNGGGNINGNTPSGLVMSNSSTAIGGNSFNGSGGGNVLRESQAPNPNLGDLSSIFSVVLNRQQHQNHHPLSHHHVRWPSFSMGNRSFWTKYCLLCTVCGSAATILAGIFLVVAALFRYYTTSIYYFETVPTYIPAILLSICGVSTIAFSCKRNRNIILLRITACWSLCSAALSSVITITTSLIHMNRLQTLKECVYTKNPPHPPSCTCYSQSFGMQGPTGPETSHFLFENTPDCDVIHGILYSCLRAVFAISVVAVLLSIFLCMLLYQLIGHERKKAYWSRIRRINSDWSADFIACLARPIPRERSSLLPLMPSLMPGTGTIPVHGPSILPPPGWGPPPSYDDACSGDSDRPLRHLTAGPRGGGGGLCGSSIQPTHSFAGVSSGGFTGGGFVNNRSSASFAFHGGHHPPPRRLRLVTSHSENSFRNAANNSSDGLMCPHPFSPTITSVDPASIFKQHSSQLNQQPQYQQNHHNNHHNHQHHHHHHHHNRHNHPSSPCNNTHNSDYLFRNSRDLERLPPSTGRTFRSLSQSQVLQRSTEDEDDDCCMSHGCRGINHHSDQLPQSTSFMTNPSERDSQFSITSLSMPDNSSMSVTIKSSNEIPFNDNENPDDETNNINLSKDDLPITHSNNGNHTEETGFSDPELSLTSNCTASAEAVIRSGNGICIDGAIALNSLGKNKVTSKQNAPPTTSSEPKIISANKNNSFSTVADQRNTSSSVINSDTDIILNKKALEFWGSLKKHKNFSYYGGSGNSTSRRRRKDKSKSSLSKISSLPCSPFMNMRRKLFGPGGKSLECVQNLNYNFSYSMTPMEAMDVSSLMLNNDKSNKTNHHTTSSALMTSDEMFKNDNKVANNKRKESCESSKSDSAVTTAFHLQNNAPSSVRRNSSISSNSIVKDSLAGPELQDGSVSLKMENCSQEGEIRPELT